MEHGALGIIIAIGFFAFLITSEICDLIRSKRRKENKPSNKE